MVNISDISWLYIAYRRKNSKNPEHPEHKRYNYIIRNELRGKKRMKKTIIITKKHFRNGKKEHLNPRILCQVTMTSLKTNDVRPTKHEQKHENKGKEIKFKLKIIFYITKLMKWIKRT